MPDAAHMAEATLIDEMIEAMKAKIGVELRIDHSTNNEVATRLAAVMPGKATVALPSPEVGTNSVQRRMRPGLTRQALFTGWGAIPATRNTVR